VALLRARAAALKLKRTDDEDWNMGLELLHDALSRPVQQIASNAGHDGTVVSHRILREKKDSYGFDALKGTYGDMLEAGIVDPAKVTKAALNNAVSVATLLLTTDALITTKPEPKKAKPGGPGGGMGEDDMGGMGGMDF